MKTFNPASVPANVKEIEARFVGKTFGAFHMGTNPKFVADRTDFHFRQNGEAVRVITHADGRRSHDVLNWTLEDDLTGCIPQSSSGSAQSFWFRPTGKHEWRQSTKDGRRDELQFVPDAEDPGKRHSGPLSALAGIGNLACSSVMVMVMVDGGWWMVDGGWWMVDGSRSAG
jgi:hypothetical protein